MKLKKLGEFSSGEINAAIEVLNKKLIEWKKEIWLSYGSGLGYDISEPVKMLSVHNGKGQGSRIKQYNVI